MTHTAQRMLPLLEGLFEIAPMPVDMVLSKSADLIGEAFSSEKVDAFLHDEQTNSLVAVGTTRTELAHLQKSLGLDRLPMVNGDPMAHVFRTGEAYLEGHTERDERQPRGVVEAMAIRSMLAAPLEVGGVRRGVLSLASRRPDAYSADDLKLVRIVSAWVGNLVHRSELMQAAAEQAREQGRRAVAEELITVLAHDLRNLLAPISGRLTLLHERATQDNRAQDAHDTKRALNGLRRLNELMSDLLDVARVDQGLLALQRETVDIVQLVRATAETLAPPDIEIPIDSYVESLTILADRKRLSQAFENVLSNATKHSPRGVPVRVAIEPAKLQTQPAVKVTIVDQGPGIAPELLPRIFDRYVAGSASSGLGLGLYLARATVAAHGGMISMASNTAQGTRCEFVLPLPAADRPS
jgi:two-component system OmpR family sensor kinase